jgi:integrase/recombinase XerD
MPYPIQKMDTRRALQSLNSKPPKYLPPEDIHLILEAWRSNRKYELLGTLLWQTGIRITEALTLKAEDIDWNLRQLTVHTLKQRTGNITAQRNIPLSDAILPMLSLYIQQEGLKPSDYLFNMSRFAVHQKLKETVAKVMPYKRWVHAHTFRHSFAVNYLKCGGNLISLKKILGHRRIENTMIYLQLTQGDLREDIAKVSF